jgi:hypothetical protein
VIIGKSAAVLSVVSGISWASRGGWGAAGGPVLIGFGGFGTTKYASFDGGGGTKGFRINDGGFGCVLGARGASDALLKAAMRSLKDVGKDSVLTLGSEGDWGDCKTSQFTFMWGHYRRSRLAVGQFLGLLNLGQRGRRLGGVRLPQSVAQSMRF